MATLNPAMTSYLDNLIAQRQAHWDEVCDFRDYVDGEQTAQLTARQREIITGSTTKDPEFALNVCSTIINAEVDRLYVKSLGVVLPENDALPGEQNDNQEALSDAISKRVWRWWKQSRMDEGQINGHFSACRDADAYLIVDYIVDRSVFPVRPVRPRITVNQAMDGESGVEIVYEDDSPNIPLYAVKQWTLKRPVTGNVKVGKVQRRNIYFENRVEKYINENTTGALTGAMWKPYMGDGDTEMALLEDSYGNVYEAAVAWWTDSGTAEGNPLGLPVFHLRNNARGGAYGRSSIADIVPGLQDAINLSAVSLLAAAQLTGYKVATVTGINPADAPTLKVFPGAILALEQPDSSIGQLAESDLRQLIEVIQAYIINAATITSTPLSFFNISGQVAAEGTLKQQEAALLTKVKRNQTAFGNTYEDVVRMMIKLEAVFGEGVGLSMEQIDDLDINCEWEPAETRNEREVLELAIMRHKDLQTPLDVAWSEAGYTQDEIAAMQQTVDTKRNVVMGQLTALIANTETQNEAELQALRQGAQNRQQQPPQQQEAEVVEEQAA